MTKRKAPITRATKKTSTTRKPRSKRTNARTTKSSDSPRRAYLALGANLGDPRRALARAIKEVGKLGRVRRISKFVWTDPEGFADQPRYLNGVIEIETTMPSLRLLRATRAIERRLGRRPRPRNHPREIDIDILDVGGEIRTSPELTLPHPRLHRRAFVLSPLAEIAPRWRHPVTGATVRALLSQL